MCYTLLKGLQSVPNTPRGRDVFLYAEMATFYNPDLGARQRALSEDWTEVFGEVPKHLRCSAITQWYKCSYTALRGACNKHTTADLPRGEQHIVVEVHVELVAREVREEPREHADGALGGRQLLHLVP